MGVFVADGAAVGVAVAEGRGVGARVTVDVIVSGVMSSPAGPQRVSKMKVSIKIGARIDWRPKSI